MTRTRKSTGRISFVGAGPGDPGLLTRRAYDALAGVDHVVFDRTVPESMLDVDPPDHARAGRVQPGRGRAGRRREGAAVRGPLRSARRSPRRRRPVRARVGGQGGAGRRAHRRAVRGRTGRLAGDRCGDVRGRTADRRTHLGRRRRRDDDRLRRRWPRPSVRGSVALAVDAGDLGGGSRRTAGLRRRADDSGRRHRRRHRRDAVHRDVHRGQRGRGGARVRRSGRAHGRCRRHPPRPAELVGEPPAVRLEGARAAHQGAGRRDERPAAQLRRDPVRGADDRGRAAADAGPDGAGDQGTGRRPVRLGHLHLGQRRTRGLGEVRRARPGRPPASAA